MCVYDTVSVCVCLRVFVSVCPACTMSTYIIFITILSFIFASSLADIGGTLLVETELIPVFESMLQVNKLIYFNFVIWRILH